MKELKIVFTKSKKKFPLASWAIMWWTKKPYSHVARAVEIRDWGYRYFHASEGKVNYEFEKFFHSKHEIVREYILEISVELDREIKKTCYEEAGNKYGMAQNLGIFLIDMVEFFTNKKIKNPWHEGKNCSELIYEKVLKVMLPELDYNPDTIKPHEVEDLILNHFEEIDGVWKLKEDS